MEKVKNRKKRSLRIFKKILIHHRKRQNKNNSFRTMNRVLNQKNSLRSENLSSPKLKKYLLSV